MWPFFLDLLFPIRSLLGAEGEWVTPDERRQLRVFPVRLEQTQLAGEGMPAIGRLAYADAYGRSPILRKALRSFKYGHHSALADDLGALLLRASVLLPAGDSLPILCPVPLHWTRLFSRGFNQAHLLASVVGRERGWPVRTLLARRRPTGYQAHRTSAERMHALDDAFVCCTQVPAHVILIDDIATTGATLNACAMVLRAAGVRTVDALVVARG